VCGEVYFLSVECNELVSSRMNTMGSRESSHVTEGFKSSGCGISNHSTPCVSISGLFLTLCFHGNE